MRTVTLQNEVLGLKLTLLRAEPAAGMKDESDFVYTGVRADGEPALPMTGFSEDSSALYELDVRYDIAWRWISRSALGYVSARDRLRLLLGDAVTIGDWTLRAAPW